MGLNTLGRKPPYLPTARSDGHWVLRGTIARQSTTHDVTFDWILGHEYVQMQTRRWGDGERADRLRRLAVEHRTPVHAAILGLPDAPRRRADVSDERVGGFANHCNRAIPLRADEAVVESRPQRRIHLLGSGAAKR